MAMAPQMPRPPSQIRRAAHGLPSLPQYGSGVVMTW